MDAGFSSSLHTPHALMAAYRGRFAPTPSGPLHQGSLVAALASWLDARSVRGRWLLRIDDLDRERCGPETESVILRQLEAHGLTWDETPRRQSAHLEEYRTALAQLTESDRTYSCTCTRAQLQRDALQGLDGQVYSGRCRVAGIHEGRHSVRFRVSDGIFTYQDLIQGRIQRDLTADVGDFVLRRSDGIYGYHLACVVDEAAQAITHIVRGADLISSTIAQIALQQALMLPTPVYAHLPVLNDAQGRKLSKQNGATPLDSRCCGEQIFVALAALGQQPPQALRGATPSELLQWALKHWRLASVPSGAHLREAAHLHSFRTPASGILP